ncbi:MAG: 23S rRNA (pseudouridine(1915)-N(3))-methyltransferase RlmH [Candidatus Zixiibacteriota bacterium]
MLNIRIITVGKDKDRWISDGCDHYVKLLSRFAGVELKFLPTLKSTVSLSPEVIKAKESGKLAGAIGHEYYIALHDRGRAYDSPALAKRLQQVEVDSRGTVVFVIGGAWGLDKRLLEHANEVWSLSSLTFSHQLVRLILLEQLYRAYSILRGTDYHK